MVCILFYSEKIVYVLRRIFPLIEYLCWIPCIDSDFYKAVFTVLYQTNEIDKHFVHVSATFLVVFVKYNEMWVFVVLR